MNEEPYGKDEELLRPVEVQGEKQIPFGNDKGEMAKGEMAKGEMAKGEMAKGEMAKVKMTKGRNDKQARGVILKRWQT